MGCTASVDVKEIPKDFSKESKRCYDLKNYQINIENAIISTEMNALKKVINDHKTTEENKQKKAIIHAYALNICVKTGHSCMFQYLVENKIAKIVPFYKFNEKGVITFHHIFSNTYRECDDIPSYGHVGIITYIIENHEKDFIKFINISEIPYKVFTSNQLIAYLAKNKPELINVKHPQLNYALKMKLGVV